MKSTHLVFEVTIPIWSDYAISPEKVTNRVIPLIREVEPKADMVQVSNTRWTLTTPSVTAVEVTEVLTCHYRFSAEETGSIWK